MLTLLASFSDEIKLHKKSNLGEKRLTVVCSFRLQSITAGISYSVWFQVVIIAEMTLEQRLWRTISLHTKSEEERNGCTNPHAQLDSPLIYSSKSIRLLGKVKPAVGWTSNLNKCNEDNAHRHAHSPT